MSTEFIYPELYRSNCKKCGLFIDSTYCEKEEDDYICYGCGKLHKVERYSVEMLHLDGRKKKGIIKPKTSITDIVISALSQGWSMSYSEISEGEVA